MFQNGFNETPGLRNITSGAGAGAAVIAAGEEVQNRVGVAIERNSDKFGFGLGHFIQF